MASRNPSSMSGPNLKKQKIKPYQSQANFNNSGQKTMQNFNQRSESPAFFGKTGMSPRALSPISNIEEEEKKIL